MKSSTSNVLFLLLARSPFTTRWNEPIQLKKQINLKTLHSFIYSFTPNPVHANYGLGKNPIIYLDQIHENTQWM